MAAFLGVALCVALVTSSVVQAAGGPDAGTIWDDSDDDDALDEMRADTKNWRGLKEEEWEANPLTKEDMARCGLSAACGVRGRC